MNKQSETPALWEHSGMSGMCTNYSSA